MPFYPLYFVNWSILMDPRSSIAASILTSENEKSSSLIRGHFVNELASFRRPSVRQRQSPRSSTSNLGNSSIASAMAIAPFSVRILSFKFINRSFGLTLKQLASATAPFHVIPFWCKVISSRLFILVKAAANAALPPTSWRFRPATLRRVFLGLSRFIRIFTELCSSGIFFENNCK